MTTPKAPTGPVEHIETLYQRYMATGLKSDGLAWMDAAHSEAKLRWGKYAPASMSEVQEATRQQYATVDPHRCRRCGIDTTLAIWCIDCIDL